MGKLQVQQEKVKVLTVTVIRGHGIAVPSVLGEWETPDPYVKLRVSTSPNAKQQTTAKPDDRNPVWNESFKFYLNSEKKNTLELIVMDEDFGFDDKVGRKKIELDELPLNDQIRRVVQFNKKKTSLEVLLLVNYDETSELRFSHDLCDEEKDFVKQRKQAIFNKMSKVLPGNKMPKNVNEVPTIAIMGSGGGYRAACGFSGVFCALEEAGILDVATYVSGLSGSSWYISTLYSIDGWPGIKCRDVYEDLKRRFDTSILSHFHVLDFAKKATEKRKKGQPVRFTDIFGMAIGDALLQNEDSKLSDQVEKVKKGGLPLPICTCIRVHNDVSAKMFHEWVEFSPYEFGIAEYGVFAKTRDFGGKFYKGHLVKKFDESPLHYLQGVWGSAFSIILNSYTGDEKGKKPSEESSKKELEKEVLAAADCTKGEDDDSEDEEGPEDEIDDKNWITEALNPSNIFATRRGKAAETFNIFRGLKFQSEKAKELANAQGKAKTMFKSVFNTFRRKKSKSEKAKELLDAPGKAKTMCVVDSGIAFNSPYPVVIRPERKIDLILSFDFSQREGGDTALPFKELLAAEEWAKENDIPFPPIKTNPATMHKNIRECYVFDKPDDPTCPTVLHFVLINKEFRNYKKPGVPRVTKEEKDFANFDIFDDPEEPYSSFTFQYDPKTFDRLHSLMEFNTHLKMDLIKENIAKQVENRRNNPHLYSR